MSAAPSESLFSGQAVIDVRSPLEYARGHVPGAMNLPLFTDEERKMVGICYKNQGQDAAIELGYEIVNPKRQALLEQAELIAPEKEAVMYCWRGGLRSASMAEFLGEHGFSIELIGGGYKAWRTEVMELFKSPLQLIVLSGMTGCRKTDLLHALTAKGEQVIDLEGLAQHKGSAFGGDGDLQPSSEHFENLLAQELLKLNPNQITWIEDESRSIGRVFINVDLFQSMQQAPMVLMSRSTDERVATLCEMYGQSDMDELKQGFIQIKKRIGGQYLNAALDYIDKGDLPSAARIALRYYDKAYQYGLAKNDSDCLYQLHATGKTIEEAAEELIEWKKQLATKFA